MIYDTKFVNMTLMYFLYAKLSMCTYFHLIKDTSLILKKIYCTPAQSFFYCLLITWQEICSVESEHAGNDPEMMDFYCVEDKEPLKQQLGGNVSKNNLVSSDSHR